MDWTQDLLTLRHAIVQTVPAVFGDSPRTRPFSAWLESLKTV